MHSKTSKQRKLPSPWKAEFSCSEEQLNQIALELAQKLCPRDRVLLEGQMGAGKTTFARSLLSGLGITQPPEGSPTFAIAHEYYSKNVGEIIHIDFYRLKSELEIEEAGILAYFWEREALVICEWLSSWPQLQSQVLRTGRTWRVSLSFIEGDRLKRNIEII